MPKLCNFRSARVIQVAEIVTCEGEGTKANPFRQVTTYTALDGRILAVTDEFVKAQEPPPPDTPMACRQCGRPHVTDPAVPKGVFR